MKDVIIAHHLEWQKLHEMCIESLAKRFATISTKQRSAIRLYANNQILVAVVDDTTNQIRSDTADNALEAALAALDLKQHIYA